MATPATFGQVQEPQTYYESILGADVQHNGFKDMDDPANLESLMQTAQKRSTCNFIVDFSDTASWVCFDLSAPAIDMLMAAERPETLNTRWINVLYPQRHRSLLELLAKRYDFSPRLLSLMCSDPKTMRQASSTTPPHATHRSRLWHGRSSPAAADIEKGVDELSEHSFISSYDSVARGNLYNIISDIWHYSSIDFGRSFVCLGYNSIYGTKDTGDEAGEGPLPHCTRVWTWLLLCDDNTVISINEDPFPFSNGRLDPLQERVFTETRCNLVSVFRSLSRVDLDPLMAKAPMTLLPLRARLGNTVEETAHRQSDMPGLLFYYLFENWQNSYTLITRKESRYGVELNNLRAEMFQLPKLCHIDRLDSIGKELGVLRRHYESYNRIIDRLLEPQTATAASLQNSRIMTEASQSSLDTIRPLVAERESLLGVSLSSAARVRFKRLRDLIDLYALSEVEEYIKQKDALVAMVSHPTFSRIYVLSGIVAVLTTSRPELQLDCHQGIARCRTFDTHHAAVDQSHDTVLACQFADCVL